MSDLCSTLSQAVEKAAHAICKAELLIICSGAGMGVDSGLPDFRGTDGFWRAYPKAKALGLSFTQMADPVNFVQNPWLAWGLYGHRHNLYRHTSPHRGFDILKRWSESAPSGSLVFTSNVDGHFHKAGFSERRTLECHGSIRHLQCSAPCCNDIWPAPGLDIEVCEQNLRAEEPLPKCPHCGGVARPNILMFNDWNWHSSRCQQQTTRYESLLDDITPDQRVIVEIGADLAVPTVRMEAEDLASEGSTLIRINPRDPEVPHCNNISLPLGGLNALNLIDKRLHS